MRNYKFINRYSIFKGKGIILNLKKTSTGVLESGLQNCRVHGVLRGVRYISDKDKMFGDEHIS